MGRCKMLSGVGAPVERPLSPERPRRRMTCCRVLQHDLVGHSVAEQFDPVDSAPSGLCVVALHIKVSSRLWFQIDAVSPRSRCNDGSGLSNEVARV